MLRLKFISANRSRATPREPRGKIREYKHPPSAESFIAARDVFFRSRWCFQFHVKSHWCNRAPIRQHVNKQTRTVLRATSIESIRYKRQIPRNIGNLSVLQSCFAKKGGRLWGYLRQALIHHLLRIYGLSDVVWAYTQV